MEGRAGAGAGGAGHARETGGGIIYGYVNVGCEKQEKRKRNSEAEVVDIGGFFSPPPLFSPDVMVVHSGFAQHRTTPQW